MHEITLEIGFAVESIDRLYSSDKILFPRSCLFWLYYYIHINACITYVCIEKNKKKKMEKRKSIKFHRAEILTWSNFSIYVYENMFLG